jgi:hypothetical protein
MILKYSIYIKRYPQKDSGNINSVIIHSQDFSIPRISSIPNKPTMADTAPPPAEDPPKDGGEKKEEKPKKELPRIFLNLAPQLMHSIRENDMCKAQGLVMGGVDLDYRDKKCELKLVSNTAIAY